VTALTYRPFVTETDFAPLVALLGAVEAADQDGEDVSAATLREQLRWPGHDPERDRVVALAADADTSLVGYGALFKTSGDAIADAYVAVHPSWRRKGVGARLLSLLVERARLLDAEGLRCYANAVNPAATAFVRAQGFTPVASYTRLGVDDVFSFPPPPELPGFELRAFDQINDPAIFLQAVNRSYEGLWGHHHLSDEEVAVWLPALAHEGILLLFADTGAIAGMCRVEINARLTESRGRRTALVHAPGIVPGYRDQDLYHPLLLNALSWAVQRQAERIEIASWGDAPAILDAYCALGFVMLQEAISYQRLLKE
jgi:mycothiol synthase